MRFCLFVGNIKDAALLSLVGALKDLKLPAATYDQDTNELTIDPESTRHLQLTSLPVPLTFTVSWVLIKSLCSATTTDNKSGRLHLWLEVFW